MPYQCSELKDNLKGLLNSARSIEPELLRSFVTYWSLRKISFLIPTNSFDQIKKSNLNLWLNLVRSNHRFRSKYGEETANEIVKIINDTRGFVFFVP